VGIPELVATDSQQALRAVGWMQNFAAKVASERMGLVASLDTSSMLAKSRCAGPPPSCRLLFSANDEEVFRPGIPDQLIDPCSFRDAGC